jgi:hypothetical protein
MKLRKIGVVLLALLLAAMAMVPMVSALSTPVNQDILLDSIDNKTTTYHGDTLKEIKWVTHPIDASKAIKPYPKEEFLSVNKEYIDYLTKTIGKEATDKMVNDLYTKKATTSIGLMGAPDPTNIKQILNKDVWIWAYETKTFPNHDLDDPDAGPITYVVLGNTNDEFATFLTSKGWGRTGLAFVEFGDRGPSKSSLDWDLGAINMAKPDGDNRYHCTIHAGGYSSVLGDDWSYGECHYDVGPTHTVNPGCGTQGEAYLYNTVGSSYNKYSSNLENAGIYFDGNGHVYKVR